MEDVGFGNSGFEFGALNLGFEFTIYPKPRVGLT